MRWIRWFDELGRGDVALVGGKNASLGEMVRHLKAAGVQVPEGFALTADAYRHVLEANGLEEVVSAQLAGVDYDDVEELQRRARRLRSAVLGSDLPRDLVDEVAQAYARLGEDVEVAVRSSATAEDLPTASFAGQQESFLHVSGLPALLDSVRACMASLFTARAIGYRHDMGFADLPVALSVGVQRMVRAGGASSGVIFTLDPESGFRGVVLVTSSYGLGENIVQGRVGPDEFYVHKATLREGFEPILARRCGPKELRLVPGPNGSSLRNLPVPPEERQKLSLVDADVLQLARWALAIEEHYGTPMDIEWAKDAVTGELFIVQARPETVHSQRSPVVRSFRLEGRGQVLQQGLAVGEAVATGNVRVITDPRGMHEFCAGEILVTEATDPDWEPILKKAAGVITARGGRTSHAAIVARELGIPALVGAQGCLQTLSTGQQVTLSCAEGETGSVYAGAVPFSVEEVDPTTLERPLTSMMLNLANPGEAYRLAQLPSQGVGLARMEFIFASFVKVHPLALTRFATLAPADRQAVEELTAGYDSKTEYFVDRLSEGIGTLAAAFHPRPVILRFSDFKTNEYSHLVGGASFEPQEENPMLGWRGASRYYHPDYKEGFLLEAAAVRRVREKMGLRNLVVMVPFCRTPAEGQKVLATLAEAGLQRGQDGLEVYVMAEIPSNIWLADEFAQLFDGFSIGSNDLTQLMLGVDRDSELVAPLFDERNRCVREACAKLIEVAHAHGRKVGICGQAPSDYPDFAAFLVQAGIDSLSLTPDALVRTSRRILELERGLCLRT